MMHRGKQMAGERRAVGKRKKIPPELREMLEDVQREIRS
jgi:hypothetical protein